MKYKKNILNKALAVLLSVIFTLSPLAIKAETISYPDTWITVQLVSVKIPTTYKKSEYQVEYNIKENKLIAKIIDNDTQKIISKYSEEIENEQIKEMMLLKSANLVSARATSTYTTTLDGNFNLVGGSSKFQAYVWIRAKVSYGSYWRQCDELLDYGHTAGSSGGYTLEGNQSFDGTSSYPTGTVRIDINGIIQTTSSLSASIGLNYEIVKGLGFTMGGSSTSYWYGRKSYNTSASFVFMS